MFKVGQDVFESKNGWGKINSINSEPQDPSPVSVAFSDGQYLSYTLDGRYEESDPFPTLFESPEAMIEYFQENAPPKPKKKIKKTVEVYIKPSLIGDDGSEPIYDAVLWGKNPGNKNWVPATLTYEIEE